MPRPTCRSIPSYRGFDISLPAVKRAVAKYGEGKYQLYEGVIASLRQRFGAADVVFCRDVVLHQLDPYGFLAACSTSRRGPSSCACVLGTEAPQS